MSIGAYTTILKELSEALKSNTPLEPDDNYSCLLAFSGGAEVQIELTETEESLLMLMRIAPVPPGAFRVNIFTEALKANALPFPSPGTFAYSEQSDELILFKTIGIDHLTGYKVSDHLKLFLLLGSQWRTALEKGEVPKVISPAASDASFGQGIFGLRP